MKAKDKVHQVYPEATCLRETGSFASGTTRFKVLPRPNARKALAMDNQERRAWASAWREIQRKGEPMSRPDSEARVKTATVGLTKRQRQIVSLLAEGHTAEQCAAALHRSIGTIRRHIVLACERVYARNTTHLVALAITHGWVVLEPREDPLEAPAVDKAVS
ncbi:response regulator transcription factor [Halomonas sp. LBP4]|uniref:response regulator transcription factor n=1 Tax=Halomonas sp. LBP4 TaxID=2044917 RepID=UPI000D758F9D|nr:helix-turn-helix transcriptional regulator [Halomonas sp. LBP4]PXX95963.1 hypothetical protein CR157_17375 [Halomonas sp. LBP4]